MTLNSPRRSVISLHPPSPHLLSHPPHLWKPRRANIDVLNPDTKSEIPTRKMKSRHESEIQTRNPDMKSEIPTRNPDMKSDCFILIRAHQNFLSRRPLPKSDCTALALWQLAVASISEHAYVRACNMFIWAGIPFISPLGIFHFLRSLGSFGFGSFCALMAGQLLILDRSQFVVVGGESSSSAKVLSGVPQGSFLGPYCSCFILMMSLRSWWEFV